MKVMRKVFGEEDVPKDLLLLLLISGLFFLSIALSNTFVNIFLWKHTKSFVDLGLYNLMIVIFQPLTFLLAGRLAKKVDRVIVLRLGVIFLALFFISVLILGSKTNDYLLLFGTLLGVGYGFYWLAFNVLTFEITEPETRDFFNGFQGILSSIAGMVGPISAGWMISSLEEYTGYKLIFGISLALFTIAIITSWFLKRRPASGHFTFRRIIKERKNNIDWRGILYAHFFQGLREGTFMFVIVLWVFIATGSELSLGKFGLIESGAMFLGYYLASRLIKPKFRKKSIFVAGIVLYMSIYLILFNLTYPLLITYGIISALAFPFLVVPYGSLTFDVIGKGWKAAEKRIEYIVVRELFYNSGRVISILLFLGMVSIFGDYSIKYLLMVIGIGHVAVFFFIRHITLKKSPDPEPDPKSEETSAKRRNNQLDEESGSTI
ncbi:MFS transporter [Tuberibacillus sp. Marseille-P3662]|uniref:MFS transporter n=1 Tax=Tuberibacillus sp. Marseille-P3662 TaxID=1965358 RepID=UPI00111BD52C